MLIKHQNYQINFINNLIIYLMINSGIKQKTLFEQIIEIFNQPIRWKHLFFQEWNKWLFMSKSFLII